MEIVGYINNATPQEYEKAVQGSIEKPLAVEPTAQNLQSTPAKPVGRIVPIGGILTPRKEVANPNDLYTYAKIKAANIDITIDEDPDIPDTSKAYLKLHKYKMTPEQLKQSMDVFAGRTEKQKENGAMTRFATGAVTGATEGAIIGAWAEGIGAVPGAVIGGLGKGLGQAIFGDSKNYYLDNDGIPQPLGYGEAAPHGSQVEDTFGDTYRSNALKNAAGSFVNAIMETGNILPTVASVAEKGFTGKDGMFTKAANQVNQSLLTSNLHVDVSQKGVVNAEHIHKISDLLDGEAWNPSALPGLVGGLAAMVVTFGGGAKLVSTGAKATKAALDAGKSIEAIQTANTVKTVTATTTMLLGGHLEAAKEAGLTPREQAITATIGALGEAMLFHIGGTAMANVLGQKAAKEGIREITAAVANSVKATAGMATSERVAMGLQSFMETAGKSMDSWIARFPKSAALNIGQMEAIDLYNHGVKQIADATLGYDETTKAGFHDSLTSNTAIAGYLESAISGSLFGILHNPATTDANRGKVIFDKLIHGKESELLEALKGMNEQKRLTPEGYEQAKNMIAKYKQYMESMKGSKLSPGQQQEILQNSYEHDLLKSKINALSSVDNAKLKADGTTIHVQKSKNGKGYDDANVKGRHYTDEQVEILPKDPIEEGNLKALNKEAGAKINKIAELMSGGKASETTIKEDEQEQQKKDAETSTPKKTVKTVGALKAQELITKLKEERDAKVDATDDQAEIDAIMADYEKQIVSLERGEHLTQEEKNQVVSPLFDDEGNIIDPLKIKVKSKAEAEEPVEELGPHGKAKKELVEKLKNGEKITGEISKPVNKTAVKQYGSETGTGFDFTTSTGEVYDMYSHTGYHDTILDTDLKNKNVTLNHVPEKEGSDGKKYKDVIEVKIGDRVVGHIRETEKETYDAKKNEDEYIKHGREWLNKKYEDRISLLNEQYDDVALIYNEFAGKVANNKLVNKIAEKISKVTDTPAIDDIERIEKYIKKIGEAEIARRLSGNNNEALQRNLKEMGFSDSEFKKAKEDKKKKSSQPAPETKKEEKQETEPEVVEVITEDQAPELKKKSALEEFTPEDKGIEFQVTKKIKAVYDRSTNKFRYFNSKGREYKEGKQFSNIANKLASRAFKTWHEELATDKQKKKVADIIDTLQSAPNKDHDEHEVSMRSVIMRNIRNVFFSPVIMKDLTDVNGKKWISKTGHPLDTFVSDHLLAIMHDHGYSGDEQDLMNDVKEVIMDFPQGIKVSDIKKEDKGNEAYDLMDDMREQFLETTGLGLDNSLPIIQEIYENNKRGVEKEAGSESEDEGHRVVSETEEAPAEEEPKIKNWNSPTLKKINDALGKTIINKPGEPPKTFINIPGATQFHDLVVKGLQKAIKFVDDILPDILKNKGTLEDAIAKGFNLFKKEVPEWYKKLSPVEQDDFEDQFYAIFEKKRERIAYFASGKASEEDIREEAADLGQTVEQFKENMGQYGDANDKEAHNYAALRFMYVDEDTNIPYVKDTTEHELKEQISRFTKTFKWDVNNIRTGYFSIDNPELVNYWEKNPLKFSKESFDRMYVTFTSYEPLPNYHIINTDGSFKLMHSNPETAKAEEISGYEKTLETHPKVSAAEFTKLKEDTATEKKKIIAEINKVVPQLISLRAQIRNATNNGRPSNEIKQLTEKFDKLKDSSEILGLFHDYVLQDAKLLEKITGISDVNWMHLADSMNAKHADTVDQYMYKFFVENKTAAESPLAFHILQKANTVEKLEKVLTDIAPGKKWNQLSSMAKATIEKQVSGLADSFEDVKGKRTSSNEGHSFPTLHINDITKNKDNPEYKEAIKSLGWENGVKLVRINGIKNTFLHGDEAASDLSNFNPHDAIVTQLTSFLHSGISQQAGEGKYFQFLDQQSDSKSKYLVNVPKRSVSEIKSEVENIESKSSLQKEVDFIQKRLLDQVAKKNIKLPNGTNVTDVAKEFVYNYVFNKYHADEYLRTKDIHKPGTKLYNDYRMQIKRKIFGAGEGLILGKENGIGDTYKAAVINDPEVLAEIKGVFSKKIELTDGQIYLMPWHNDAIANSSGQKYKGIVKDFHYQHLDGHEVMMKGNGVVITEEMAKANPVIAKLIEAARAQKIDRFVMDSSAKLIQPEHRNKVTYEYSADGKNVTGIKLPAKLKTVDLDSRMLRIQQDLTNKGTLKEGKLTTQIVNIIKQLPNHKDIEKLFAEATKKAYKEVTDEFFSLDSEGRKEWFTDNIANTPENLPLLELLSSPKSSMNDPSIALYSHKVFGSIIEQRLLNLEANKGLAIHAKIPGMNHEAMQVGKDKLIHPEATFPAGMERTDANPNGIKKGESAFIIRVPSDNFHSTTFSSAKGFHDPALKNTFTGDQGYQVSSGHDNDGDGAHIWTLYRDKKGNVVDNNSYKGLMNKVYLELEKQYSDPKNLKLLTDPIDTNQVDPHIKKYQEKQNKLSPNLFSSWLTMFDSNRQSRVVVGAMANGQKVTYNLQAIGATLKKNILFPKFNAEGIPTGYHTNMTGFTGKLNHLINSILGNNLNQALDDPKLAKLYAMGVTAATVNVHNLVMGQDPGVLGDLIHFLNHPVIQIYNRVHNEAKSPTSNIEDIFHETAKQLNGGRDLLADENVFEFRKPADRNEESRANSKGMVKNDVWNKNTPPTKDILDPNKRTIENDLRVLNYFQYLDFAARDYMTLNKVINLNDNGIRSYGELIAAEKALKKITDNKLNVIDVKGLMSSDSIERARQNIDITRKYYNETLAGSPIMTGIEKHLTAEFQKLNPRFNLTEDHLNSAFRALHEFAIVQGLDIKKSKEELRSSAAEVFQKLPADNELRNLFELSKDGQLQLRPEFKRKRLDAVELKKYQSAFSKLSEADKDALLQYQIKQYGWTKSTKLGGFYPYINLSTKLKVGKAIDKIIPELNAASDDTIKQVVKQIQLNNPDLIPEAKFTFEINKNILKREHKESKGNPQLVKSGKFLIEKQTDTSGAELYNTAEDEPGVTPLKNSRTGYTPLEIDSAKQSEPLKFEEPMNYAMGKAENIHRKDTTTFDLIKEGNRTSTTRGYWNNVTKGKITPEEMVGRELTFLSPKGQKVKIVVDSVHKVTAEDRKNPDFLKQWSDKEGWTEKHLLKETKVGDYQMEFHLADKSDPNIKYQSESDRPYLKDDPTFRNFVYDKISKHFPFVQQFKDPIAFQQFLDKHFPGQQLDFSKLGAAIGDAFWINEDSARQDTPLHEAAHIFWDILPVDDSIKLKMLQKWGTEEDAVRQIGLAATEQTVNEMSAKAQSWIKTFWNRVKAALWGGKSGEDYAKIMATRMFSNEVAAHTNVMANQILKYHGDDHYINEEGRKKQREKIEKELGKPLTEIKSTDFVDASRKYVTIKKDENLITKSYEDAFTSFPVDEDGKIKEASINNYTKSHFSNVTYDDLVEAVRKNPDNKIAKENMKLAEQYYDQYKDGLKVTEKILKELNPEMISEAKDEWSSTRDKLALFSANELKTMIDKISVAFGHEIDDPFSSFVHDFLTDYYTGALAAKAIREESKADYVDVPVFTTALAGALFDKNSPDWIEGFKSWLSGNPKFKSPMLVEENMLKASQIVKGRAFQQSLMDGGRYINDFNGISERIKAASGDIKDIIYRPSIKDTDGNLVPAAEEIWLNDQTPETREKYRELMADNSEKAKAYKDFLNKWKEMMNEMSGYTANQPEFYKVRQVEMDEWHMQEKIGPAKTIAVKVSGDKKYDDIAVNYADSAGNYMTLGAAKEQIIEGTKKGIIGALKSRNIIKRLTRQAENLYHGGSPFDQAGRIIIRGEKIGPDAREFRGAKKPIGTPGISTVKSEYMTENTEAALHQYIQKLSFKHNMDLQRPILNYFENYFDQSGKKVIAQWLKDMNSSFLYHDNPESILGNRWGKFLDWWNGYTAWKFLALNLHAPQFNLMAGMTQNYRNLGVKKMATGFKRMSEGLKPNAQFSEGFVSSYFTDFLHTYQIVDITRAADMSLGSAYLEKIKQVAFSTVTYPEYLIHGLTICGSLKEKEWTDFKQWVKDGKKGNPPISKDRILHLLNEDRAISGSYHALARKRINLTPEGRALMSMKNWLPDLWDAHFLSEREDMFFNKQKGIYMSAYDVFNKVFLGKEGTISERWNNLPDIDKENMNKVGRELYLVAGFGMLGAMFNDDKENYNKISRMMADIGWVYDINNYRFLLNSPVPAFKSVSDGLAAVQAVMKTVTGDAAMKMQRDGKYALNGESKAPVILLQAAPGSGLLKPLLEEDKNN